MMENKPKYLSRIERRNVRTTWQPWERNVPDAMKSLSNEEIIKQLAEQSFPYAVLMENWVGDFNFASLIRNANNFGAKEIFYLGNKRFDRRGCVGSYVYKPVINLPDVSALAELKSKYTFVGFENIPGSLDIRDFQYPKNSLLIFGEEGPGITKETLQLCDHIVAIPGFGSARSLNASTASGIAMYDFVSKFRKC